MRVAQKFKKEITQIFIYFFVVFLLLLASVNIKNYMAPKKVLGVQTKSPDTTTFWTDFVGKNPNYIPGWIEVGRSDQAVKIDPNYIKP